MKEKKPIPKQAINPKRGSVFIVIETGEEVYLERVKSRECYLVCDNEQRRLEDNYTEYNPAELKVPGSARSPITYTPPPKTKEQKAHDAALNVWFDMQIAKIPATCQECGQPLKSNLFSKFEQRCVLAHCLPKREKMFPELALHPENCLYLCAKNGCHARFDELGADVRSKMKVYQIALQKFENMKSKLSESQIMKANKYLNIK